MNSKIQFLTVRFDLPIQKEQVAQLRGAIASKVEHQYFHNHGRYGYPLVQYKVIDQLGSIQFIGEGVAQQQLLFEQDSWRYINLAGKDVKLKILHFQEGATQPKIEQTTCFRYNIRHWFPFRDPASANYKKFADSKYLTDKIALLEHILGGNILTLLKGCGIWLDTTEVKVSCRIVDIQGGLQGQMSVPKPGIPATPVFDLTFDSNIQLPPYIGLGNHVRVGNGMVFPNHE